MCCAKLLFLFLLHFVGQTSVVNLRLFLLSVPGVYTNPKQKKYKNHFQANLLCYCKFSLKPKIVFHYFFVFLFFVVAFWLKSNLNENIFRGQPLPHPVFVSKALIIRLKSWALTNNSKKKKKKELNPLCIKALPQIFFKNKFSKINQ